MKFPKISGNDVAREVILALIGTVISGWVVSQIPQLRTWIKAQWE